MNKIILMGRLTRDPEVRYTQSDKPMAIARYSLAVDRKSAKRHVVNDERPCDTECCGSRGITGSAAYRFSGDRFKRDGDENTDFIPCVAFGKNGEFAEKYLTKGMKIAVIGRLQVRHWEDNNGDRRTTTEAIVEEQYFCSQRNDAASMTSDHVARSVAGGEECGGMQRTALAGTESKGSGKSVNQTTREQNQDFYPADDEDEDLPF